MEDQTEFRHHMKRKRLDRHGKSTKKDHRKRQMKISNNQTILKSIAAFFLISGIVALVIYFTVKNTDDLNNFAFCDDEINLTSFEIGMCMERECTFDPAVCAFPCPFGYHTGDHIFCPQSCECAQEGNFEGDIHFDAESVPGLLQTYGLVEETEDEFSLFSGTVRKSVSLWPKGRNRRVRIPYDFGDTITEIQNLAKTAFKTFASRSCFDFVPKSASDEYSIKFSNEGPCASFIGKHTRNGPQTVWLSKNCRLLGVIQHELLHLLGFNHEHSHSLRDDYVTVNIHNVRKGKEHNFKKIDKESTMDLGTEYDRTSVLHYGGFSFSKNRNSPTIVDRSTNKPIKSQRIGFTDIDVEDLNSLYKCSEAGSKGTAGTTGSTGSSGSVSNSKGTTSKGSTGSTSYSFKGLTGLSSKGSSWLTRLGFKGFTYKGQSWSIPKKVTKAPTKYKGYTWSSKYSYKGYFGSRGFSSNWGQWGKWSACWKTCGSAAFRRRYRRCTGQHCTGPKSETKACPAIRPCPRPAVQWSKWTLYGRCSKTCGAGFQMRIRRCPKSNGCGNEKRFAVTSCYIRRCTVTSSFFRNNCYGSRCYGDDSSPDLDADETFPAFFSETKLEGPEICPVTRKNSWLFDDFDGDQLTDIMCGSLDGGNMKVVLNTYTGLQPEVTFEALTQDCQMATKIAADFDGDGFKDILCRDQSNIRIKLQKDFQFVAGFDFTSTFCVADNDVAKVIDANGDGKSDILCWHRAANTESFQIQLG